MDLCRCVGGGVCVLCLGMCVCFMCGGVCVDMCVMCGCVCVCVMFGYVCVMCGYVCVLCVGMRVCVMCGYVCVGVLCVGMCNLHEALGKGLIRGVFNEFCIHILANSLTNFSLVSKYRHAHVFTWYNGSISCSVCMYCVCMCACQ